jgi:hypothetical protein
MFHTGKTAISRKEKIKMARKKETGKKTEATAATKNKTDAGVMTKLEKPKLELKDALVRYEFSSEELAQIGSRVAELSERADTLEERKKSTAKDFDSDIKHVELEVAGLLRSLRDQWEMRTMECYEVFDYKRKKAFFFRADLIELNTLKEFASVEDLISLSEKHPEDYGLAKVRDMHRHELQRELPFEEAESGDTDIENVESADKAESDAGKKEMTVKTD